MLKVHFIQKIACSNIKCLAIIIGYLINKEYCNIKIIRLYFSRCAIDSLTTSKLKFCHFFTQVVSNLHELLSCAEHKIRYFVECSNQTVDGPH